MNLGQYDNAIIDYDTAIQLKPDDAIAYYNRGIAKFNLGQYIAAISNYDEALRLKPDYTKVYVDRGVAKANLGRDWEAKQDLHTALRLAEESGDPSLKARIEQLFQNIQ